MKSIGAWRLWLISYVLPSGATLLITTTAAWVWRRRLNELLDQKPGLLPAVTISLAVWLALGGMILIVHSQLKSNKLRARIEALIGLARLQQPSKLSRWRKQLPDPFEWLFQPFLQTAWGRRRAKEWKLAGLGEKGSRYLMALMLAAGLAMFSGFMLAGLLLAFAFGILAPLIPYRVVANRSRSVARRFSDQVPSALEALAAGLSAGMSFHQTVGFAVQELPSPIADSMADIHRRIELGHPVEQVLQTWLDGQQDESLSLAIDGILLQRQMGGNLLEILRHTAKLARERIELDRDVQAVTAQGRLSGWVIGALVPVSAALLLATNPRYIDILFNTIIGQALLVAALVLQLVGWLVISRLIRVTY